MNGAEFKTIRESCGLSVPDMAKFAVSPRTGEPVGERTIRYWEAGSVPVPGDVADLLTKLDEMLSNSAEKTLEWYRNSLKQHGIGPEMVYLVRYKKNEDLWQYRPDMEGLPATCHAALINRARLALWEAGCATTIVWMETSEYSRWLSGKKDSESLRAQWAAKKSSDSVVK